MAEYHVGCGFAGIYAGTVKPSGHEWRNKSCVTDEAISAVRDWLMGEFIKDGKTEGGYTWRTKDGREVYLRISITEAKNENA